VNFTLVQAMKATEGEQIYISTLSLTSMTDGGGWLTPRPGHLTPGKKNRYALYRRMGETQGRYRRVQETSPSLVFDLRIVQHVASRYTSYTTAAHILQGSKRNKQTYKQNGTKFHVKKSKPNPRNL
jgi:hypothetical protein